MENQDKITVSDFVINDFRTAALFSKYSIDFCCNGHQTLEAVCSKKNINHFDLLEQLNTVMATHNDNRIDFTSWPLDLLTLYIEKKHHRYVSNKIPIIVQYLDKLCIVHGTNHPELFEINDLFKGCATELTQHMKNEEDILFPFIQKMVEITFTDDYLPQPLFGTIENPIALMKDEHSTEGDRFSKIAALTNNYKPPEDACNTYRVTYAMLNDFEQDLHEHIHLENNILFPKAALLEQSFETHV